MYNGKFYKITNFVVVFLEQLDKAYLFRHLLSLEGSQRVKVRSRYCIGVGVEIVNFGNI